MCVCVPMYLAHGSHLFIFSHQWLQCSVNPGLRVQRLGSMDLPRALRGRERLMETTHRGVQTARSGKLSSARPGPETGIDRVTYRTYQQDATCHQTMLMSMPT